MKEKIINYAKNKIPRPYFEIEEQNGTLIFKIKNKIPLAKHILLVKNRNIGIRLSIPFKNSKAVLTKKHLIKLAKFGIYDIYLKIILFNKAFLYRVNFDKQNIGSSIFDNEKNYYFDSYPTIHGNLSFSLADCIFYPTLTNLSKQDNGIILTGNFLAGNNVEFDEVEIVAYSNKGGRKSFPCSYKKINSKYIFKSNIIIEFEPNEIDTSWIFHIRLKKEDIILSNCTLKTYKLSNYQKNEDYLYDKIDFNENNGLKPCIFYFCNYKFELKCNIITENKYENRIKTARHKDWYEKYKKDKLENNLIFFESFHGRYTNNPKYIYEKMLEMGLTKNYKIVWSCDTDEEIPGNPIIVRAENEDYYKYLAHAKYKISNATFPIIDTRREIVYLQTWHGTPLKRLGSDIDVKNPGIGWGHFNKEVSTWNYLVSANEFSTRTFKRAFNYRQEILECGYPANDIFYRKNDELISKIKNKLNINKNKKIILYAPTFRDDKKDENGNRYFELELDLEYMQKHLSDKYLLLIKTHSVVSEALNLSNKLSDFVIDCSNYDDIHELFIISDILITDYSSVFFDYAHTKNPIIFFTPDMESYINSRGIYYEVFEELPGPQLTNNSEIIEYIKNIETNKNDYKIKYDKFYDKYCNIGHGDASEKIINKLFKRN